MDEHNSFSYARVEGKLKLSSKVIQLMSSNVQRLAFQPESGGILLGRFISDTNDIVVDEITVPMRLDWSSRTGFRRSANPHQRILNELWLSSAGTCNYLGEWHTHPQPIPIPSNRDLISWEKQIKQLSPDYKSLFFVIAGTKQIIVWEVTNTPFTYTQLTKL